MLRSSDSVSDAAVVRRSPASASSSTKDPTGPRAAVINIRIRSAGAADADGEDERRGRKSARSASPTKRAHGSTVGVEDGVADGVADALRFVRTRAARRHFGRGARDVRGALGGGGGSGDGSASVRGVHGAPVMAGGLESAPVGALRVLPRGLFGGRAEKHTRGRKWASRGTHGYGTCFFHSIAFALDLRGYRAASESEQRSIADNFRCELTEAFTRPRYHGYVARSVSPPRSYEETRRDFCDPKAWADEIMIRHAAELLHLNVVFLDGNTGSFFCGVHGKDTAKQPTVLVLWVEGRHFEPVGLVDENDVTGASFQGLFNPVVDTKDAAIVRSILETYNQACKAKVVTPKA